MAKRAKFADLFILVGLMTLVMVPRPACANDARAIENSKLAVTKKLKNPHAAKFSEMRVVVKSGRQIVCGRVHAKNQTGRDEAPAPFVFDPGLSASGVAIIFDGGGITDDIVSKLAPIKGFQELCG